MHRLPVRIAAVMIGTILVFVATVGVSVLWLTRALNHQALDTEVRLAQAEVSDTLSELLRLGIDYAKWGEAASAVKAGDLDWLTSNMGVSATNGVATNLVVLWGGPMAADLGWADDGLTQPRSGLVDAKVLRLSEAGLSPISLGSYEGASFFAWNGGQLFAVAASRIEDVLDATSAQADDRDVARLLMGRRIDATEIAAYADSLLVAGLRIERVALSGRPSVPLLGGDGQPVAHLSWKTSRARPFCCG